MISWREPRLFEVDGVRFRLDFGPPEERTPSSDEAFCLVKTRDFVETYVRLASEKPQYVLELGIYQGGAIVLFERLFRPKRVVGIDLSTKPIPALDRYIERGSVIRPYLGTSQADRQRLDEILSSEFPDGIDLIVDDASHQYGLSRMSFEICFPYLKPGGLYILEDWSWSHDVASGSEAHPWQHAPALTNLVFEWVVSIGCTSSIGEMVIRPKMALLRRSASTAPDGRPGLVAPGRGLRGRVLQQI